MPIVNLYSWLTCVSIIGMMVITSCKSGETIEDENLYGKWEVYSAMRNGRDTPYLRGGYFAFDSQGVLTVNITGKDDSSPYRLDENLIVIEGKKDYTIKSLRKDSMDIHYILNPENEFMFFLKKTSNEKH